MTTLLQLRESVQENINQNEILPSFFIYQLLNDTFINFDEYNLKLMQEKIFPTENCQQVQQEPNKVEKLASIIKQTDLQLTNILNSLLKDKQSFLNSQNQIHFNSYIDNSKEEIMLNKVQSFEIENNENIKQVVKPLQNSKQLSSNLNNLLQVIKEKNQQLFQNLKQTDISQKNKCENTHSIQSASISQKTKQPIKNIEDLYRLPKIKPRAQIHDYLEFSLEKVDFPLCFPGEIAEENFEIQNKSNEVICLKISVLCTNSEFDDLDEFVYSVRKLTNYNYNDSQLLYLYPKQSIKLKIAIKVPNIRQQTAIQGLTKIMLQQFNEESNGNNHICMLPLMTKVQIPKLICPKEIFISKLQCSVIQLAIKQGRIMEAKVPIKNISSIKLNVEFEVLNPFRINKKENDNDEIKYFQNILILAQPQTLTILPNTLLYITLNAKNLNSGPLHQNINIKQFLIMKVLNSTILITYPLNIEFY